MSIRNILELNTLAQLAEDHDKNDFATVIYYAQFGFFPSFIKIDIHNNQFDNLLAFLKQKYKLTYDDYFTDTLMDSEHNHVLVAFYACSVEEKLVFAGEGRMGLCVMYCNDDNESEIFDLTKNLSEKFNVLDKKKPELAMVINNGMGEYKLIRVENNPIKLDVSTHYNDDFLVVHNTITESLNTFDTKGLILLHGKPGTGKTTYLKYLLQLIEKKNLIYMSPELASQIGTPQFMTFLMNHKNSVLIIEDAETLIQSRKQNESSVIANLLNITDGLLSEVLHIQVICTFNTNLKNIDAALLRKGRLIAQYEFCELSEDKTNKLLQELNIKTSSNEAMTLANIYNYEKNNFSDERKSQPIGFKKS